jgi:hypothetical protein
MRKSLLNITGMFAPPGRMFAAARFGGAKERTRAAAGNTELLLKSSEQASALLSAVLVQRSSDPW